MCCYAATLFPYGYEFRLAELPMTSGRTCRVAQHGRIGFEGLSMLMHWLDDGRTVVFRNNIGGIAPMIPG